MPANCLARIGTELWCQKLQQDPEFDLYVALIDHVIKANAMTTRTRAARGAVMPFMTGDRRIHRT
jgi:hypothetical protein